MITVHAVGDLVLEREDAWPLLEPSAGVLATADVRIGHLEIPHAVDPLVQTTDVPAIPGPPSALDAAARAGFDVLTLAGNHIHDFGPQGIRDTVAHCAERGILTAGAGEDLDAAFAPAILDAAGTRLGVVSVNCVGPRDTWATSLKPGAAYVEVITHYEPRGANPGGPPRIDTFAEPRSLRRFTDAVAAAAESVDILVVALHKGLVHVPIDIAEYEREVSRAAIDAGAHAVIGHHAHICKGVEVYRGRPILHGLGNFATVTQALGGKDDDSPERAAWARQRRRMFGFDPDPSMPDYPFHPESRNTAIAVLEFSGDDIGAALLPCWIDDDARPVPVAGTPRGRAVSDYLRAITAGAGFATTFEDDGALLRVRMHDN